VEGAIVPEPPDGDSSAIPTSEIATVTEIDAPTDVCT